MVFTNNYEESDYPNNVWMYYDGELPQLLLTLYQRAHDVLKYNWNLQLLTPLSLHLFLDSQSFPKTFHLYTPQAQSDLIRLMLLKKYGGWWIDVSTIINSDLFMIQARQESIRTNASFFGYCFKQCPRGLIESSLIYAPKRSLFIQAWEEEYNEALLLGRSAYIYQSYRNGIDLPIQLFKPYPFIYPYFTIYATEKVALVRQIPRNTTIRTHDANTQIYKLLNDCRWQLNCSILALRSELTHRRYQVTKLWSWWRGKAWPGSGAVSKSTNIEPDNIPLDDQHLHVMIKSKHFWMWKVFSQTYSLLALYILSRNIL